MCWQRGVLWALVLGLGCADGDTTDRVTSDPIQGEGGQSPGGAGGSTSSAGSGGEGGAQGGAGAGTAGAGASGAGAGGGPALCVPGQQLECACPGGQSKGAQACKEDGSGFGPCEGCAAGAGGSGASGGSDAGSSGNGTAGDPFGGGGAGNGGTGGGGSGGTGGGGSGTGGGGSGGSGGAGCAVQGCGTVEGSMAGCEGATVIGRLDAAAGYASSGSTCGAGNSSDHVSCYDIGEDRSYRVYLRKDDAVTFTVTSKESCSGGSSSWQMSLKVFTSGSCEAPSCESPSSEPDCKAPATKKTISYKATKDAWVTLVIDGFTAEAKGAYDLAVKLTCAGGCGC